MPDQLTISQIRALPALTKPDGAQPSHQYVWSLIKRSVASGELTPPVRVGSTDVYSAVEVTALLEKRRKGLGRDTEQS